MSFSGSAVNIDHLFPIKLSKGTLAAARDKQVKCTQYLRLDVNSIEDIAALATGKYAWSPILWSGDKRHGDNFEQCSLIVLDFDNNPSEEQMTLEGAETYCREQGLAYVLTPSKNHRKDKHGDGHIVDRFRLILFPEKPYETLVAYRTAYASALAEFPAADTATGDAARCWMPGTPHSCSAGRPWVPHIAAVQSSKRTKKPMTRGSRNESIFQEACEMRDRGFSLNEALANLRELNAAAPDPLPEDEVASTVRSAYKGGNLQRVARGKHAQRKVRQQRRAQKWFKQQGWELTLNLLSGRVQVNGENINEWHFTKFSQEGPFERNRMLLEELIKYEAMQRPRHPLKEFLESAEPDPSVDYIRIFFDQLQFDTNRLGNMSLDDLARIWRKWLIAMVGRIYEPTITNFVLVLQSNRQGVNKTRFCHLLGRALPGPNSYGSQDLNLKSRDDQLRMRETWLWNLDEFDQMSSKADQAALKALLSATKLDVRRYYERESEGFNLPTSFIATTNAMDFLQDDTGSRRFRVFPLIRVDLNEKIDKAFVHKMMGQALGAWRAGECYWPTAEENLKYEEGINALFAAEDFINVLADCVRAGEDIMNAGEILCLYSPDYRCTKRDSGRLKTLLVKRGFKYLAWRHASGNKKGFRINAQSLLRRTSDTFTVLKNKDAVEEPTS